MGRIVHFEIHASEPHKLVAFYQSLFGWNITQWGTNAYWLVQTDAGDQPGITNGGILPRRGPAPIDGQPVNCFVSVVEVTSADDALALAVALGGTVAVTKVPVHGVGWVAYAKDPDGNIFGLLQPDKEAA